MALDTEQKRGSSIDVGLPYREWLTKPSATIGADARASLLKLSAGESSSDEAGKNWHICVSPIRAGI